MTPDELQPDRVDAIVDGQLADGAAESGLAAIVSALRTDRGQAPAELRSRVLERAVARRAVRRGIPAFLRWPAIGAGLAPVFAAAALMVGFWPSPSPPPASQTSGITAAAPPTAGSDAASGAASSGAAPQAAGRLAPERLTDTTAGVAPGARERDNSAEGAVKTLTRPGPTARSKAAPVPSESRIPTERLIIATGLGVVAATVLAAMIVRWARRRRLPRPFLDG